MTVPPTRLLRDPPLWHLIERPRAPFRCDVCGRAIPDQESWSFTTLPKMFYDTPPAGMMPCNRARVPATTTFDHLAPAGADAAAVHDVLAATPQEEPES